MPARFQPVLARKLEATPSSLIIHTRSERLEVLWERCSPTLANATEIERTQFRLSAGGYGIYWPLLDEDLAVGALVEENERHH